MNDGWEQPTVFTCSLEESEYRYMQIETEMLAFMFSMRKFKHFLLKRSFCADSSAQAVTGNPKAANPTMATSTLQRWAFHCHSAKQKVIVRALPHLRNIW